MPHPEGWALSKGTIRLLNEVYSRNVADLAVVTNIGGVSNGNLSLLQIVVDKVTGKVERLTLTVRQQVSKEITIRFQDLAVFVDTFAPTAVETKCGFEDRALLPVIVGREHNIKGIIGAIRLTADLQHLFGD